jgi:transposase
VLERVTTISTRRRWPWPRRRDPGQRGVVWVAQWLAVAGSRVSPDVGTLRRLYVDEGLSLAALAARLGVVAQTVQNWLVAGGVPRRPSPARFRADIDDGEIVRLYTQQGLTAAEIAEQVGCSTSLVYGRLARGGVDRRPQALRRRPGPTTQEFSHLYGDCGLSLRDLAERDGVTTRAVRGWLVAAGIDRRPSGTAGVACDGDELVALYRAGWSAPAIADLMGCSSSTIYRRLAAAGIARRPPRRALSRQDLIAARAGVVGARDRYRPRGQHVMRVPSPRPRESHDRGPGHQATDKTPLPQVLRQARPIACQRQRQRHLPTLKDSPNFCLTLALRLIGLVGRDAALRATSAPGPRQITRAADVTPLDNDGARVQSGHQRHRATAGPRLLPRLPSTRAGL